MAKMQRLEGKGGLFRLLLCSTYFTAKVVKRPVMEGAGMGALRAFPSSPRPHVASRAGAPTFHSIAAESALRMLDEIGTGPDLETR